MMKTDLCLFWTSSVAGYLVKHMIQEFYTQTCMGVDTISKWGGGGGSVTTACGVCKMF